MKEWTNELNRYFSKKEVQIAKIFLKSEEMFNMPGHKRIQIKAMLRFHLTSDRMATILSNNKKYW
jgi:hypothetical protein